MNSTFRPRLTACLCAVMLLAACGGKSEADAITAAKAAIGKNDSRTAVIELKTAIQANPNAGEARYLLGKLLLDSDDLGAASVELRKAMATSFAPDLVIPAVARAELLRGQFKTVADEFGTKVLQDPVATADLKSSLAAALTVLGRTKDAEAAIDAALAASPKYSPALLFRARLMADAGNYDGALKQIDDLVSGAPGYGDAYRVRGDILAYGKGDVPGAVAAYEKAVEIKPGDTTAHTAMIGLLTATGQIDKAQEKFKAFKQRFPDHLQSKFFDAEFAYHRKDHKAAREALLQLLRLAPGSVRALQLAGANELALNSLTQAETYLTKALQFSPESTNIRLLLARAQLRAGLGPKVVATLKPLIEGSSPNPMALAMTAEANLLGGDPRLAEQLYAQAMKLSPENAQLATGRARARLVKGETDAAMSDLTQIAGRDVGVEADLVLAATHMQRNDWKAALKVVDGLDKKRPKSAFVSALRGEVKLKQDDVPGARSAFEQALALDPAYFPAISGLAAIDIGEQKSHAARQRFEEVLKVNPKHMPARLGLVRAMAASGARSEDIFKAVQDAVAADPSDISARLMLIDQHLASRNVKAALAAARELEPLSPDHPSVVETLGLAQLAAGELQQSLTTFNRLAGMRPKSPGPQLRIAQVYLERKESEAAIASYKRALQISPDYIPAQVALISTALAAQRSELATEVAKSVRSRYPDSAHGYALDGDILASRKDWAGAASAYATAAGKRDASNNVAVRQYSALLSSGKTAEAEASAAQWAKTHPGDASFHFKLARLLESKGDLVGAESRLKESLRVQPQGAAALNNLATLLLKQKRTGALAYAEKSAALYPDNPAILDTLSSAMMTEGSADKALEVQKKVISIVGAAPSPYTLTLARIYAKLGKRDLALAELDKLAALGAKFEDHKEVADLSASLKK